MATEKYRRPDPSEYRCWWLEEKTPEEIKPWDRIGEGGIHCKLVECPHLYRFHELLCTRVPGNDYKGWTPCRDIATCPLGMQKKPKLEKRQV